MDYKVPENPYQNRSGSFTPLVVVTAVLVTLYLTANLMAVKIIRIGSFSLFDAGTITFPLTYMLGDVLAEVWGYRTAKRVIWLTFACNVMLVFFTGIGVLLPYPEYMESTQQAYSTIYTYVPRIVIASLISFLLGELANAKMLVMIKKWQKDGRHLWIRTIGSSVAGYLIDTAFFVIIAFYGTVPDGELIFMIAVQYAAKLLIEAVFGTPLAYAAVSYIKRRFQ